jgi:hypothetical protein
MSESHRESSQDQIPGDSRANAVHEAGLIWDEYKYRHDLIWRHLIRSTTAIVALLTVQFLTSLERNPVLILAACVIAIVYTLFTWWIMEFELRLFEPVKKEYRERQRALFDLDLDSGASDIFTFRRRVRLYIFLLLLLAIGATVTYVLVKPGCPAPDAMELGCCRP